MKTRAYLGPVLALLLAGCASGSAAPAPDELTLGVDACDYCHMAIDDPAAAAQWITPAGHAHKFDEPGCLLAWLQRSPGVAGAGFVADAGGAGWVPAPEAHLVQGGAKTPMGFGIVAFRDMEDAERRAAETGGRPVDWETVRTEGVADAHAR